MGASISTMVGATGLKSTEEEVCTTNDEDQRPAKRQKTSSFDGDSGFPIMNRLPGDSPRRKPFGHVTNESRHAPRLAEVKPASFYGKGPPTDKSLKSLEKAHRALRQRRGISSCLPSNPGQFKEALRIEFTHIDTSRAEPINFMKHRKSVEVRCKCTVAIFYKVEDSTFDAPDNFEVYKKIKPCTFRIQCVDGKVTREVLSLEPFYVTAKELEVDRNGNAYLADDYHLQVTIERDSAEKDWPPFDMFTTDKPGDIAANPTFKSKLVHWEERNGLSDLRLRIVAIMWGLLNPESQTKHIPLRLGRGKHSEPLPYVLGVDITWSLPSQPNAGNSTKLALRPNSPSRKPNGHTAISPSPSELHQEDGFNNSPSRAERRRKDVQYNLKVLSAQAQGKLPKIPKPSKLGAFQDYSVDPSSTLVTYTFGDAADYGVKSKTTIFGLKCPFCPCKNSSLDELRLHLRLNHTHFKFELCSTNPDKPKISIKLIKQKSSSATLDQRTFQLGRPQSLFNLQKFLNGDDSWVIARQGPAHSQWPEHLLDLHLASSASPSPYDSRQSSPNTSNTTEGAMDIDYHLKNPSRAANERKRIVVPRLKNNKCTFDNITHRVLEPGEDLPASDDERDEFWVDQKHRDIILDFTDLAIDEKDYLTRWNPFAMKAHLCSAKHLPEMVLQFAKKEESWFLQKPSRIVEFGEHMETFVMRGVITPECYTKALDILRRAERTKREADDDGMAVDEQLPISPARPARSLLCICGEVVMPGARVVCRGPVRLLSLGVSSFILTYNDRVARFDFSTANAYNIHRGRSRDTGFAAVVLLNLSILRRGVYVVFVWKC
jgi:hypothetical protein